MAKIAGKDEFYWDQLFSFGWNVGRNYIRKKHFSVDLVCKQNNKKIRLLIL